MSQGGFPLKLLNWRVCKGGCWRLRRYVDACTNSSKRRETTQKGGHALSVTPACTLCLVAFKAAWTEVLPEHLPVQHLKGQLTPLALADSQREPQVQQRIYHTDLIDAAQIDGAQSDV